ncbi:unnamed protein product [Leptosia nina]|uniref:Uncharacterized protein n=1 Tax=Leptosia nina TaxID=320188 RepID=A0AAV1JC81_9NEOP
MSNLKSTFKSAGTNQGCPIKGGTLRGFPHESPVLSLVLQTYLELSVRSARTAEGVALGEFSAAHNTHIQILV